MLNIDLTGRRALVAGVADDAGYGFAIARSLAEAGATIVVATWPPALPIFRKLIDGGRIDESRRLSNGDMLEFERIYPLDAAFDCLEDVPPEIRENKRYLDVGDYTLEGVATRLEEDLGSRPLDFVVHSLANGPEVKKPLTETSRSGYLSAISISAYSMIGMVQKFSPLMREGGSFLSLSFLASERVVPGYGGGMSSAKAALESDTRVLAYEAGQKDNLRVNCISAGPYPSRAARAIGKLDHMVDYCSDNSPISQPMSTGEVGSAAAFLVSPLATGITGTVLYVDKGYHVMGLPAAATGNGSPPTRD